MLELRRGREILECQSECAEMLYTGEVLLSWTIASCDFAIYESAFIGPVLEI